MTCIVAVRTDDGIWMGGDSAGVNGYLGQTIVATAKVWQSDGFVYGFTDSFRIGDLLRYRFEPPRPYEGDDVSTYMGNRWIEAVRTCFKVGGYNGSEGGRDAGGQFLVGYRGRLFKVQGDYSVLESADDVLAVGCGAELALGALHATEGRKPETRIRVALEAASRFSAGVAPPFHVEHLSAKEAA